jgi:prepilin-type N-terminal cleavage/methylation domain-containing protein
MPLPLRAAFTLIEILVACVVLCVGVLALASTSVAVARLSGDASRAGTAAERGQGRLEAMRAARCATTGGSLATAGIAEWWSAAPSSAGALLQDSVRYTEGVHHALHTETLVSESWCP